ncbi:sensor histidine kinase [Actinomadura logoneensis]|uniref:histidine kinase n=1 Tax=Actinomadura logoneensis TaxID=2293572 RepID=A0A372JLK8_9ACTN|nr:sensor histidine kinase [Actinomadura logoneensis]RFU40696.1 sensor histidine kinase [Actinomadura logoneensis]
MVVGWPRGRAADVAIAAGVLVVVTAGSAQSLYAPRTESWTVTAVGWGLILAVCGSLVARRRHPVPVAVFTLVTSIVYYLLSDYDGPLLVAFIVALYTVAESGRPRVAAGIGSIAVGLVGFGTMAGNGDVNGIALFMLAGWLVAVVVIGWLRHTTAAHARAVEQRAATEERLRIARELHDVVGHHLSLISVQSAAALRRYGKDRRRGEEMAEESLAAIRETSTEALRELRVMLGVLRQDGEDAPTAPAQGLDSLGDLVERARSAGLRVRADVSGPGRPPTEVGLAAYRIVQEALTNVVRHARASSVDVRVERAVDAVTIEVVDDGPAAAHPLPPRPPDASDDRWTAEPQPETHPAKAASGSGIGGMRERARALGGELEAGPGPDGGFRVRARLPHEKRTA